MGCGSCGTNGKGCGGGGCASGSCNKMNTFDWLSNLDIEDNNGYDFIEVSFKQGARKGFYKKHDFLSVYPGDVVVVEAESGYDIGEVSLMGELVRAQIKKKKKTSDTILHKILRIANDRDVERLEDARSQEHDAMLKARNIAKDLDLEMKIGDVEYQGDKRKATFFYTADGRVDFRELIRQFARTFGVKIEMRQIGARQESARIGGIGTCGRELCCSTWLSDFKTVSTAAARYQNLAINQAKLSGMCGRLKCCLNFELDGYLEALEDFPKNVDTIRTEIGTTQLMKVDIFKRIMFYTYRDNDQMRGKFFALSVESVKELVEMKKNGKMVRDLSEMTIAAPPVSEEDELDYESVNEVITELPEVKKKRRNNRSKRGKGRPNNNNRSKSNNEQDAAKKQNPKSGTRQNNEKGGVRKVRKHPPKKKPTENTSQQGQAKPNVDAKQNNADKKSNSPKRNNKRRRPNNKRKPNNPNNNNNNKEADK